MNAKRILSIGLAIVAVALVAVSPGRAETKNDLETFRAELAVFWPQLLSVEREAQNLTVFMGVPPSAINQLTALETQDPIAVEQEIANLPDDQLAFLKQQYDLLPGWRQIPHDVMAGMSPALRSSLATLAALAPADQPFPPIPGGSFVDQVCGVVDEFNNLQDQQIYTDAMLISYNVASGIYIVADTACMAYPCSVLGIFDIIPAIAGKLATCGVAGVLAKVEATFRGLYDNGLACETQRVYDGSLRRLDEKLSTAASDDSVGVRTPANPFTNETIHAKLEDRLDVQMTTRSTADSVEGVRSGRPPSLEKSVRTVVDHTDLVRLPDLERTLDETLALAKQQGELMRNFRNLLIRMQIESDLIDTGKKYREALFQLPNATTGHKRAFCQRDISAPCVAPGPDRTMGTSDDVADATLCPDDSQPSERCDFDAGVCSRTRATPCNTNAECPGGEVCEFTSHPCDHTHSIECSFDADCPLGRAKQGCVEAEPQRGFIELVREITQEAIDLTNATGEEIHDALEEMAAADAKVAAGDLKNGYDGFRRAYKEAVRINARTGH